MFRDVRLGQVPIVVTFVVVASGCNQVFDIRETRLSDTTAFRGCPAPGETPELRTFPVTVSSGEFPFDYTFDEARTFAVAQRVNQGGIVQGPIDTDAFTPLNLARDTGDFLTSPRLSPEGDELFVTVRDSTLSWSLRSYTRSAPQTWSRGPTLFALDGPDDQVSTPTRKTSERRLMRRDRLGTGLAEHAERNGTWTPIRVYDRVALGITDAPFDPQLSPDGLRLVFTVREVVGWPIYYTDRATIDGDFGPARLLLRLTGDAEPHDPILTQDCVRLYFIVFPGLTYVEQ